MPSPRGLVINPKGLGLRFTKRKKVSEKKVAGDKTCNNLHWGSAIFPWGGGREDIVYGDDDRCMFLRTPGEMAKRTGIRIHAYALMNNHYRLVLETPKANLVAGMQWFQTTYTRRFSVKLEG